jgi:hypothetical protein
MKHHKQKTNKQRKRKKLELEKTWNFKLLFPHLHKVRWRGGVPI